MRRTRGFAKQTEGLRADLKACVAILMAVMCILAASAAAQTVKGTIFGTVTDASGAVVPGATITVTEIGTETTREVVTGADGYFVVPALLPGRYRVRAQKEGFQERIVEPVILVVDARQQVDLELAVAGTQAEVTVTSGAAVVETGSAAIGQLINQRAMVDLPLNGRNFLQLVLLSAGASPLGNVSDSAGFNRPSVNISGGREASNQFTIDGVFNNVIHFEGLNLQPSVDSIQEFKVQHNTFSAEFGHGTAIVNVATRAGTNEFHGTMYEFLRNEVLDARQFFDQKKPPFRQNQFGGVIGGPIIKKKTFFFFSYEGFRMRRSNTLIGTLPTAAMLSGDFTGLPAIRDPLTGLPFPGNVIPQARFSAVTTRILPLLPQIATGGANNFVVAPAFLNDSDQYSIRIDHEFSKRDAVFGRFTWADTALHTPGLVDMTGSTVTDPPRNGGVQWTHTFRGNLLNEARVGFNRNLQNRLQDGANNSQLNVLQFQNAVNAPINYGLPTIILAGFTGFGTSPVLPEIVGGNTFQVEDTLTWVKNHHTFKFGVDIRNTQMPHTPYALSRGLFVFQGFVTGNPVADFLLGNPFISLGAGKGPTAFMSMKGFAAFAQDDWHVTRTLTLNYGLRYERLSALDERFRGRLGVFDPRVGAVVPPNQVESEGLINPDNNNFGHRVGFAWQPFGSVKTVLRGGYGLYYDVKPLNEYNFSLGTELNFQQIVDINPLLGLPPGVNWDSLFPVSAGVGIGILTDDPFARTPYVQQWSLGVQRDLPRDIILEVLYAGSAGHKLNRRVDVNQATLPATPGDPLAPRRPYPSLGSVLQAQNTAWSNYHSLQARLEKRVSKSLYFLAVYTFSKSLDTSSNNPEVPQDQRNQAAEYGLSGFDQRQRFVFSSSWVLPFGKGQRFASSNSVVNQIMGGWQFNSIVTISSGIPFTVGVGGTDRSQTGTFAGGFQRANIVGPDNGNLPRGERSVDRWFNTAAFQVAPLGTFGNSGRNIVIGPGTQNFDLSLFKDIRFTERFTLQFRSEFFNAFNKAQFNLPVADPTSPAFGQITSVRPAREIQFGLKFMF